MQQETSRSTVIPALRRRDAHAAIEWLRRVPGFERRLVAPSAKVREAHRVMEQEEQPRGGSLFAVRDPEGRLRSVGPGHPRAEAQVGCTG